MFVVHPHNFLDRTANFGLQAMQSLWSSGVAPIWLASESPSQGWDSLRGTQELSTLH
jgi:hypothetical protein